MKKFLLILAYAPILSIAQTLEKHIPASSDIVIEFSGDALLNLVSMNEFQQTELGTKILKNINRELKWSTGHREEIAVETISNEGSQKEETPEVPIEEIEPIQISKLEELGFDYNSKAYFFFEVTDSISYINFIIKLKDSKAFENTLMKGEKDNIEQNGKYKTTGKYTEKTIWNNDFLIISSYEKSRYYFNSQRDRFEHLVEGDEDYYDVKRRYSNMWRNTYIQNILNSNLDPITNNKNYLSTKNNNSAIYFWANNLSETITRALRSDRRYRRYKRFDLDVDDLSSFTGLDGAYANLVFDESKISMEANFEISKKFQEDYLKIYDSKINSKFFKYFNEDNTLAYWSTSSDFKAMLESYPNLVKSLYQDSYPDYKEEVEVAADIFSILFDEEAIASTITGDMLFILNDLKEKEVEYVTYDYDENYNRTEVTKTKTEFSPEFTIMVGSENEELFSKLAKLGEKHKVLKNENGYYDFKMPRRTPFDLYGLMKDDIVIFTSSKEQIEAIQNGTFKSNAKTDKKLMQKNNMVFKMNGKAIMQKLPNDEFRRREKEVLRSLQDYIDSDIILTNTLENGSIKFKGEMTTSEKEKNSLIYFLNILSEFTKL